MLILIFDNYRVILVYSYHSLKICCKLLVYFDVFECIEQNQSIYNC